MASSIQPTTTLSRLGRWYKTTPTFRSDTVDHQTPMIAYFTPYNFSNPGRVDSCENWLTWALPCFPLGSLLDFNLSILTNLALWSLVMWQGAMGLPRLQRCHLSLLYWLDLKLHHVVDLWTQIGFAPCFCSSPLLSSLVTWHGVGAKVLH